MEMKLRAAIATSVMIFILALFPGLDHAQSRRSKTDTRTSMRPQHRVQLTARVEKGVIQPGEPDTLILYVRNDSKAVVNLVETYPERDYAFDVKDQSGKCVSLTENGEKLVSNTSIYRRGPLKIQPGKDVYHRVIISQLYDMTAPGEYSVSVSRKIFGPDFKLLTTVTSVPVKVIVR